jgi:hypothetical protein
MPAGSQGSQGLSTLRHELEGVAREAGGKREQPAAVTRLEVAVAELAPRTAESGAVVDHEEDKVSDDDCGPQKARARRQSGHVMTQQPEDTAPPTAPEDRVLRTQPGEGWLCPRPKSSAGLLRR